MILHGNGDGDGVVVLAIVMYGLQQYKVLFLNWGMLEEDLDRN